MSDKDSSSPSSSSSSSTSPSQQQPPQPPPASKKPVTASSNKRSGLVSSLVASFNQPEEPLPPLSRTRSAAPAPNAQTREYSAGSRSFVSSTRTDRGPNLSPKKEEPPKIEELKKPAPPPKPAGNKAAAADAPRPAKAEAQEKPPERPPKSTPKEEQMTCPICNEVLRGSNSQINSHIDACLKKQQKLEKESQKPKNKSGWGWFSRSDDSDKEKQEKEKQEKLPVPEKIPQAAVAAAEAEESKTAVTALDNFEEELDDTRKDSAEDVDAAESIASVFAAGYARDPRFAVELIRVLLDSYFGIVKKNIRDTVPKTIMYFLIHQTAENLHSHLLQTLYSEDNLDKLLEESQEIMEKRETAKRNLDILERASRIISEIRDSSSF